MKIIERLKRIIREVERSNEDNLNTRLLIGSLLAKIDSKSIRDSEFKVFSQFGDDGIIQHLIKVISPNINKFVEFGVENYEEANTKFLLMNNNWSGLIIDGSFKNIDYIRKSLTYWKYDLTAVNSFITAENINDILQSNGFGGQIGLLSIDIDGNDYWVWKAIKGTEADIVVIEYNSLFGAERAITVPYNSDFFRSHAHYSNLYFGASLTALNDLGKEKGYVFVGCNQAGNNAYFVKKALSKNLSLPSVNEGFVVAKFREARNMQGELTLVGIKDREKEISGMPVFNTRTGTIEYI